MKVIFVGLHHKPNKPALCSSTDSGKLIDQVIARLEGVECIKTNLYPGTAVPDNPKPYVDQFMATTDSGALHILLGKKVQKQLWGFGLNTLLFHHPGFALRQGLYSQREYVDEMVGWIEQSLGMITITLTVRQVED